MIKKILIIVLAISIIANSILIIYLIKRPASDEGNSQVAAYPYLSPRIFSLAQNDVIINFVNLRIKLNQYVSQIKDPFGMYFEYLPSGISIGINEKDSYVLASLLKTPMIMAVYKQIEEGKWNEDDILTVQKEDIDPLFGDLWRKGPGAKLTVAELIRLTLIDSDNTAKSVLFSHLPDGALEDVFDYLDIPKQLSGPLPVVTPKNYSSILRSLYLSSYLTKEYSNKILDFSTQSKFDDKLAASIPKTVKVAHKIGVYNKDVPGKSVFTDCGIVYVPRRPYILCLMTKESEPLAQKHMSEISKLIYDYITNTDANNTN